MNYSEANYSEAIYSEAIYSEANYQPSLKLRLAKQQSELQCMTINNKKGHLSRQPSMIEVNKLLFITVNCQVTKFFLDSEKLVVFAYPVSSAG